MHKQQHHNSTPIQLRGHHNHNIQHNRHRTSSSNLHNNPRRFLRVNNINAVATSTIVLVLSEALLCCGQSTNSTDSEDTQQRDLGIGLGVAIGVVVLIIIVYLVCTLHKKSDADDDPKHPNDYNDTDSHSSGPAPANGSGWMQEVTPDANHHRLQRRKSWVDEVEEVHDDVMRRLGINLDVSSDEETKPSPKMPKRNSSTRRSSTNKERKPKKRASSMSKKRADVEKFTQVDSDSDDGGIQITRSTKSKKSVPAESHTDLDLIVATPTLRDDTIITPTRRPIKSEANLNFGQSNGSSNGYHSNGHNHTSPISNGASGISRTARPGERSRGSIARTLHVKQDTML